jgi:hypothetical protein
VHAYAAIRIFEIDGYKDFEFLERVLHKLTINFTWWVNREDPGGMNVFSGGFLGLDNIAPFDRSKLPPGWSLEQSDGTAWMAFYALSLLELALLLAGHDDSYEDLATKFFEHFTYIAIAMDDQGLWHEQDGFFYDMLRGPNGSREPVPVRSVVGLIPMLAVTTLEPDLLHRLDGFRGRMEWFERHRPHFAGVCAHSRDLGHQDRRLLSVLSPERLVRVLARMADESEFLSPYGVRALSRYHKDHPYVLNVMGHEHRVDYEPAESSTGLFGGNSNWRGPIWFPVNYLLIESLQKFHYFLGDQYTVEYPTGSGHRATLWQVAGEISRRLTHVFLKDERGRRPVFGGTDMFQEHAHWQDAIPFYEYFHGDNGAGIGASHQTGWTGLVAKLIQQSGE